MANTTRNTVIRPVFTARPGSAGNCSLRENRASIHVLASTSMNRPVKNASHLDGDDFGADAPVMRTSACTRMTDMLAAAAQRDGWRGRVRTDDGWRQPLADGSGFRHEYDDDVADGGWEFRVLRPGLSLALVNYTVMKPTSRRHAPGDNLVLSAVLSGASGMHDDNGFEGALADGYCTVYGVHDSDEFKTSYERDEHLKWVSVFIQRDAFFEITGLDENDLPPGLLDFLQSDKPFPPRNVPLSSAALIAATDIFDNSLNGGFTRAYLTAKALELACQILFILARSFDEGLNGPCFTQADFERLKKAKALLEQNLDEPLNVMEISRATGMPRQKLQLGFRLVYGDTVGRVRDKLRMKHALHLVRTSDMSMIEIALETGYEHHASFTRAFKAAFGVSPASMRQSARQSALMVKTAPETV